MESGNLQLHNYLKQFQLLLGNFSDLKLNLEKIKTSLPKQNIWEKIFDCKFWEFLLQNGKTKFSANFATAATTFAFS